jgi:gamma-glutamylaminecyclotransferase
MKNLHGFYPPHTPLPGALFVYGTLMRGEANHRLLRGSQFIGTAKTVRGFSLFDHGYFPAMVRMGDSIVSGEVFEITDETLRALDRLEGYPILYGRMVPRPCTEW